VVRLLVGKIGRSAFRCFDFYLATRFDLDQPFRRGLVLLVRLEPNLSPQDFLVVIDRHGSAGAAILRLALANFVSIVQVVVAGTDGDFEPAIAILIAGEQRAIGAGNVGTLGVCNRVADEISRWILGAECLDRTIEFALHNS